MKEFPPELQRATSTARQNIISRRLAIHPVIRFYPPQAKRLN